MRRFVAAVTTAVLAGGIVGTMGAGSAGAQTDNTAFCDQVLVVDREFNAPEPDPAALGAAFADLVAAAPPEIAAGAQQLATAVQTAGEAGGDPTEDPAFGEGLAAVGEYVFTNCGWQSAEVDMSEYAFTGLPKSFTTGPVAIKLTNSGAEVHELQVLRIKSSKDKLKKIVNLPEKKARKKVEILGNGFALPGETGYAFLDFTKSGNYGGVCFVPVGSTPDAEEGGDGPPHAHEGMIEAFKVTKAAS
jgi:hypothetical protein